MHAHTYTHTCHPWNLFCCRTERHFSSSDNFFFSSDVGTIRSLYLRCTHKKNKRQKSVRLLEKMLETPFQNQWVQMSSGSHSRPDTQHLFLLVLPMATVAMNGQLDGDRRLSVHGMGMKGWAWEDHLLEK